MTPRDRRWAHLSIGLILVGAAALALAPSATAADTTAPSLANFQPPDGSYVNAEYRQGPGQALASFAAVVVDDESAIDFPNVSIVVWSQAEQQFHTPDSFSISEYGDPTVALALGSILLPNGAYRIDLAAPDVLGNTLYVSSNLTVDVTPPTLEVAAPSLTNQSELVVRIDARDGETGMQLPALLSYRNSCSSSTSSKPFEVVALPGRIVGEASFTLCVGSDNRFAVAVSDAAGNTVTVERTSITYDAGPPTFSDFVPSPFSRMDGPRATIQATVRDDATGVNRSRVQMILSQDGGITWGNWTNATATFSGGGVRATVSMNINAGATAAVRWRAWDLAGNGPSLSATQYFYINGAPFVVTYEPTEGTVVTQFTAVRLNATFADPDADRVTSSFRSDIDGPLGPADGRRVQLSLGVHNLTLTASDGHGHTVNYTYQVQVVVRPPPDPRPLLFTAILAGVMVWVAYAAWTKEEDLPEASLPKA